MRAVAVVEGLVAAPVAEVLELSVEVRAVVVEEIAGLRVAVVVAVVAAVLLSAVLLGLEAAKLVLLVAVEDSPALRSSSLALTLGRLRWVDVDVAVVGRLAAAPAPVVVEAGGRVGGLLRPPAARVLALLPAAALLDAAVPAVAPARRAAVVPVAAVAAVRLAAGDVVETAVFTGVLAGVEGVAGGASTFSLSAMAGNRCGRYFGLFLFDGKSQSYCACMNGSSTLSHVGQQPRNAAASCGPARFSTSRHGEHGKFCA